MTPRIGEARWCALSSVEAVVFVERSSVGARVPDKQTHFIQVQHRMTRTKGAQKDACGGRSGRRSSSLLWPVSGPTGMLNCCFPETLLMRWDTCHDSGEDQNLTTTDTLSASFLEYMGKEGSRRIVSPGMILFRVSWSNLCTSWKSR